MRVLSQGEIDNLLSNLLKDSTVLPDSLPAPSVAAQSVDVTQEVPVGIAALKAKMEAAKAAQQNQQ
jgi:hypothetical protein